MGAESPGRDPAWSPDGHSAILACDIASFGDLARTDRVQRHVRAALYDRLRHSFERSGVPFDGCYTEDRGDGALVVVPPGVKTTVLVSPLIDRLRAELRAYNDVSSEIARIQLRVGLHAGEIHTDDHGIVGTAVNHVFRLIEAPLFKEAFKASGACLAFIASEQVYQGVIRHADDLIDPADYRPIEVRVKETATRAWVRMPGEGQIPVSPTREIVIADDPDSVVYRPPSPAIGSVSDGRPAVSVFQLIDRLLDIPIMAKESGREQVVSALRRELATMIPRQSEARLDIYCILRTCLDYPGGLQELVAVLRAFAGDSMAIRALEELIAGLLRGSE
jgi:class 3 adenylate cyclase